MKSAANVLRDLSTGQPKTVRNLTVIPLHGHAGNSPGYLLLADAVAKGLITITEVSEAGSVPLLLVDNRALSPVLLLDGDHLVGCKQNRVVNVTVLVPPMSRLTIPVSCVEQGRWRSQSTSFGVSDQGMFAELRAAKVADVTENLKQHRRPQADQGGVWDCLAAKSARMGSDSASGAMSGVYGRHTQNVDSYVREFSVAPGQCGAIFAINGRVVGLDVLDSPEGWGRTARRLIAGYALDALDHYTDLFDPVTSDKVSAFRNRLEQAHESRFPGVGLGEDVRLEGDRLVGSALIHEGRAVHLCAFDLGTGRRRTTSA